MLYASSWNPITAHSDTDRGIVIHHSRCRQVSIPRSNTLSARYFPAMWGSDSKELHYKGMLKFMQKIDQEFLQILHQFLLNPILNIVNIHSRDIDSMIIEFIVEVEVLNTDSINKLMIKLRSLRYVTSCSRIVNDRKQKMKKQISTNKAPAAIGPYSQAIQWGDVVFISGQIPLNTKFRRT